MKRRSLLRNSPIFLVAGVIAFFFLATLWNFAVEPFFPKLKLRSADASLAGISKPEPVPLSFDALWSGQTQKIVSNNYGRLLPPFALAVRAGINFYIRFLVMRARMDLSSERETNSSSFFTSMSSAAAALLRT